MVPNGWTATEIGNLATFKSGGTPSKANPDYWGGDYPWISGKDLKQHYLVSSIDTLTKTGFESTNVAPIGASLVLVRGMTLLKDFPVGFATRPLAFNQDIKALIPNGDVDGLFLSYLLVAHKEEIRQLVSTAGHGTGRLETERIRSFPVKVPTVLEQKQIAQILTTWDQGIATTERLLDLARQQKKALMQQLLTGKKRFPGFEREWKAVKLGSVFSRVTARNDGQSENVVTISGQQGLIRQDEYFNRTVASETLDNYFLLKKGQFAYNKSYSIGYPMGAIKRLNRYDNGVVTTLYICFELAAEGKADSNFFEHYFESGLLNRGLTQIAHEGGRAHGLLNVKPSDFFDLKVPLPALDEQVKIAATLTAADQEIETLQSQLDGLKHEKKALMQVLLTGKRRVQLN